MLQGETAQSGFFGAAHPVQTLGNTDNGQCDWTREQCSGLVQEIGPLNFATTSYAPQVEANGKNVTSSSSLSAISHHGLSGCQEIIPTSPAPEAVSNSPTVVVSEFNGGKQRAERGVVPPYSLYDHSIIAGYKALSCNVPLCTDTFSFPSDLSLHRRQKHPKLYSCAQCKVNFSSFEQLNYHAGHTGHTPYVCDAMDCGSTFSRFDTYERHQLSHKLDVKRWPCPHCNKHRGVNGFKRKDHLTQHLRNYHHMGEEYKVDQYGQSCPHKDCEHYRNFPWSRDSSFKKISEYTKHMKKVHDESPFPCTEPGCDRIGGKGYVRKRDLLKHQKKEHERDVEQTEE
ncbi:hypothetical protein K432DRAFT_12074 [Lepidopterella palustris CBS 459.81]|uniref:C2H2-type domain-containing protein n=1 Tax=Lepidopterella palustris CBS 459.81 TaxID=1314670 RepID=A0A8E2EKB9_9PEZI|nr:hypothetical protein K432DRAFT_12074 [Lepidopterella palustris CBS 459.81]